MCRGTGEHGLWGVTSDVGVGGKGERVGRDDELSSEMPVKNSHAGYEKTNLYRSRGKKWIGSRSLDTL